jgi:mannose-6-phosphate isomerase-like protein (cupin superfamily)
MTLLGARRMSAGAAVALSLMAVVGCHDEKIGTISGPPLTIAPPLDAASTATTTATATTAAIADSGVEPFCPVNASFLDVGKDPKRIEHVACETRAVIVMQGKVSARSFVPQDKPLDDTLVAGDVMLTQGQGRYELVGDGIAVFAIVQPPACEPNQFAGLTKKVIRGKDVPALTLANGGLKVHLDVEGANAAVAYMGRLEGTAAVPEHVHETSWEVLCAVEAQGTLTLAGAARRVTSRSCTRVPPNTKHAWKPDDGTKLVAIQFYTPPGPEQRFKALASAASEGGAPPPKR